jgi:hypothetical protein
MPCYAALLAHAGRLGFGDGSKCFPIVLHLQLSFVSLMLCNAQVFLNV